jgi:hypothetical protein
LPPLARDAPVLAVGRQELGTGLPVVVIFKRGNLRPWTPHDPSVFSDPDEEVAGNVAANAREHQEHAPTPSKRSAVKADYQQEHPNEARASSDHGNRARMVAILHLPE